MGPFHEFSPPQVGELVCFEDSLRDRFVPALRGTVFVFEKVQVSASLDEDEWIFIDMVGSIRIECTNFGHAWSLIRRATLSEKDAYFRQINPATRKLNENLKGVFAPLPIRRKK